MTLETARIKTRKLIKDFKCHRLKRHEFKFQHAFIIMHEIHMIYRCAHCGKEEIVKKD